MDYEKDTTVKIAWKYYNEGSTQTEIAKELNISRMKVVKYLEKAKSENIIEFKINIEDLTTKSFQNKLIEMFKLKDVYIIPSSNNYMYSLTTAAAQYIEDRITADTMINIGYGETVSRTLGRLNISTKYNVSFVSLSGGVKFYMPTAIDHQSDYYTNPNYSHFILPSPLRVSSEALASQIKKEKPVIDIFNLIPHSNMTIIGVGALNERATLIKEGLLTRGDMEILKSKGAVGDLLSQFYDINGNLIELDLHKELISTDINLLKSLNHVVAVAGGDDKREALVGALKGGYIDVLITDEIAANSLLNQY
ncbi:lsr operon transcriptional repressor [Virgibacillus halotolerans]|uniref:sugar-binding transcriptional regulator n=1 Tax=Virgibacillus halotolerans TaxID=1071053 RepID=UPI001960F271|nr:sugar-binding domain-containing protein [Virgibacillus halotolerans]MBM7599005.1 lsr operon transcriptional repressor [Virgibacillus halotolerans]